MKQTHLLSKSVPSLVPSSQSLSSTSFVDKSNHDSPVAADPDKPHSSKRDTNSIHKASFPYSSKSKVRSAPSTGKIRTGCKRPSGLVNIGNTCKFLIESLQMHPWNFVSIWTSPNFVNRFLIISVKYLPSDEVKFEIFTPRAFLKSLKVIVDIKLPPNRPRYNSNFNWQQDAADILRYIFSDLTGLSSLVTESIETKLQVTQVCNKCFWISHQQRKLPNSYSPNAPTVGEAIDMHIADEYLFGRFLCTVWL